MAAILTEAAQPANDSTKHPRGTWIVLSLTAFLLIAAWAGLAGYQLADSVEYMERAQALVRGEEVIDSTSIRSFGFVSVIAPIFWIADRIGVEDLRVVVGLVRVLQIFLGLELVRVCISLGTRCAGRPAGLLAGCVIGFNPVFLQFAVSPVSGIAAAVCVGHAVLNLIEVGDSRRSLRAGLWIGGAILMAYQTILVGAALVGAALLRDRWRHRRQWFALCTGVGIGLFAVILLDRLCYGAWGESLMLYFRQNFGIVAARTLNTLGLTEWARSMYTMTAATFENQHGAHQQSTAADVQQMRSRFFYFTHLQELIVWPFLISFLLGLVAAARSLSWRYVIPGIALAGCALLMGYKGSQEFRLWLPLLPLIAVYAALGWNLLLGPESANTAGLRRIACGVLVALGAVFGWIRLNHNTTAGYSGYWDAMELVNEIADERDEPLRVASAWHWAVFLREAANVELIKLPHHLDGWELYDEAERAEDMTALADIDAFITHLGVLMPRPELFALFAREFEVAGAFFDHERYQGLGPILVFVRPAAGAERDAVLLDESVAANVDDFRARHGLGTGRLLVQAESEHAPDRLRLLGVDLQELPGDGHYWLTWNWLVEARLTENYLLYAEVGVRGESARSTYTRQLAHGISPSSTWAPGTIVRDGWLLILAQGVLGNATPWTPLGADRDPTQGLPLEVWAQLGTEHPTLGFLHALLPARPGAEVPYEPAERAADGRTPDGEIFDPRGYLRVQEFLVPARSDDER